MTTTPGPPERPPSAAAPGVVRDLRTIVLVQGLRAFLYGFGSILLGSVLAAGGLSAGEVGAVFTAMLGNAVRICQAKFGTLYLCEDHGFRAVAMHNAPAAYAEARKAVVHPPPDSSLVRAEASRTGEKHPDNVERRWRLR